MKRLIPVLLVLCFAGCATFNPVEEERGLVSLIELVNKGDADRLAELSVVPFLFDEEILIVKQDTDVLWKNAAKAGFTIPNPKVVEVSQADASYAKLFSDSMETAAFFRKYIPKRAVFARVESSGGTYLFILGERIRGIPSIVAVKGPIR